MAGAAFSRGMLNRDRVFPVHAEVNAELLAVCVDQATGVIRLARADDPTRMPCMGIIRKLTAAGDRAVLEARSGTLVENPAWTWAPGTDVWVSAVPGMLTQTVPNGQIIQRVGRALSPTQIALKLELEIH